MRQFGGEQHPDKQRGDEKARAESTAKFQAVSAIHALLSDADARAQYDETGLIEAPEDDLGKSPSFQMWAEYFARIFPKVSAGDIVKFEQEYRFSDEEKRDVLAAYTKFEGDMGKLMDSIMLSTEDDEERFAGLIEDAIREKQVLGPLVPCVIARMCTHHWCSLLRTGQALCQVQAIRQEASGEAGADRRAEAQEGREARKGGQRGAELDGLDPPQPGAPREW
jgi:curved DNA-binding protein CbpA